MSTAKPMPSQYPVPDDEADALVAQVLQGKPRPIEWANLTASEGADQLEHLEHWVHWLVLRYRLDPREIPPCWAEHGELVEELAALRTARQGAYAGDSPLTAPADWHQTFAATRQRLGLWMSRTGCRAGNHRIAPAPGWLWDARKMLAPAAQESGLVSTASHPA